MLSLLLVALLGLTSAKFTLSIEGAASNEELVVKGGKGGPMKFKEGEVMILKVHSSTLSTLTTVSFSYTYFPTISNYQGRAQNPPHTGSAQSAVTGDTTQNMSVEVFKIGKVGKVNGNGNNVLEMKSAIQPTYGMTVTTDSKTGKDPLVKLGDILNNGLNAEMKGGHMVINNKLWAETYVRKGDDNRWLEKLGNTNDYLQCGEKLDGIDPAGGDGMGLDSKKNAIGVGQLPTVADLKTLTGTRKAELNTDGRFDDVAGSKSGICKNLQKFLTEAGINNARLAYNDLLADGMIIYSDLYIYADSHYVLCATLRIHCRRGIG